MDNITMLLKYKAWANELVFSAVSELPDGEAIKSRQTRFGNMVHTLNHVYVIDHVFKSHLLGVPHGYSARNTQTHPSLSELWPLQKAMDSWYMGYVAKLSDDDLSASVEFEFIGGGEGSMTRAEILLHVVNHGTYHRGFVGDMMYQVPATPPANDLPVFLRDVGASSQYSVD